MKVTPQCIEQIDYEEKQLLKKQINQLERRIEQGGGDLPRLRGI